MDGLPSGMQVERTKDEAKEVIAKKQFQVIKDKIDAEQWKELMQADELKQEMRKENVFLGFEEGKYNFPPTFKVQHNETHVWSDKRTPSYCDRVLWYSHPSKSTNLKQNFFSSVTTVLTSDHKPVQGAFTVQLQEAPASAGDRKKCPDIWITNLKGENLADMDNLSKSDPYVEFRGVCLNSSKPLRTGVIMDNLNPKWKDNAVPILETQLEDLTNQYLTLVIYDSDLGGDSADDLMGWVVVPCKDGDFEGTVNLNGRASGKLRGTLTVKPPGPDGKREKRDFSGKEANHCKCVIS